MRKVTVIAAALALVWVAPAEARHHHKSACQKLKGSDLAPSKSAKLVERTRPHGITQLVGCVLPRGKVHVVATRSTTQDYTVRQVAGRYVLLNVALSGATGTDHATAVADVKSGSAYFVARMIVNDPYHDDSDLGSFITSHGTAIAAINPTRVDDVEIRMFSSKGVEGTVDSGTQEELPPGSLQLNGTIATWLHDGVVHTLAI